MIIAIDGVSGSGKTTIAREVAKKLGFGFFSTGLYYRAITYYAMQLKIPETKQEVISRLLALSDLKILCDPNGNNVCLLNGHDITENLNTEEINKNVPKYASKPYIRKFVQQLQHKTAEYTPNLVMEGRDIGSVIFPDAELKIFVTCNAKTRALRRAKQLWAKGENVDYDEVLTDLMKRDYQDTHRQHSPLVKCEDAVVIDTSTNPVCICVESIEKCYQLRKNPTLSREEQIIAEAMQYFWAKSEELAPTLTRNC